MTLEQLEDRTLLAGNVLANATALTLPASNVVRASDFIDNTSNVDLFSVQLNQGDRVTVDVDAQSIGGGLNSYLRVFFDPDELGVGAPARQIAANDDFDGRDSRLSFQAEATGTYYIGVSSFGNTDYDPATGTDATAGKTHGLFDLTVTRTAQAAALQPDLVGAVFEGSQATAVAGDPLTITYRIENRGGATTGAGFSVEFFLSANNTFEGNPPGPDISLGTVNLGALASGANTDLAPGVLETFNVAVLPAFAIGPAFIGMRIDTTGAVVESNETNNDSQRRGSDWDTLPILTPVAETAGDNNSSANAQPIVLNSRTTGEIDGSGDVDYFRIDVTETGRLSVMVEATSGSLDSVLTLLTRSGPNDELLLTSDDVAVGDVNALIQQHLLPGEYFLKVAAEPGSATAGAYELTTTFTPATPALADKSVGNRPTSVVTADFNGDGHLDLATGAGTGVSMLMGNGDGTFAEQHFIDTTGSRWLLVADFNRDGRPDLASAVFDGYVSVLLNITPDNAATPTFAPAESFLVDPRPYAMVVADFNGDGRPDLATAGLVDDHSTGYVSVLLNLTSDNGTTPLFAEQGRFAAGVRLVALQAADFNGDGRMDLVAANSRSSTVTVLLNTTPQPDPEPASTPTFANKEVFQVGLPGEGKPDFGVQPYVLLVADLNGDGRPDLATSNIGADNVSVLLNTTPQPAPDPASTPTVTFAPHQKFDVGGGPLTLVAVDFNGDGRLDLATTNFLTDDVSVLLNTTPKPDPDPVFTPTFEEQLRFGPSVARQERPGSNLNLEGRQRRLLVSDLNGDGRRDLVTVSGALDNGSVLVLLGNDDGTFAVLDPLTIAASPYALLLADFNGDGRADLAANDVSSGDVTFGSASSVPVLLGNGDGTFAATAVPALGEKPRALVAAAFNGDMVDFNGDGRQDLAAANTRTGDVSVLLGNGDGTFALERRFAVGNLPRSLVVADFNGDGRQDLATANSGSDDVSVLLGNGDGTFTLQHRFAVGIGPRTLVVADFDGDGDLDLAAANLGTSEQPRFPGQLVDFADLTAGLDKNSVSMLLGNGDGTFAAQQQFAVGVQPYALVVADFNGDGLPDLATANLASANVSVLLNAGTADPLAPRFAPLVQLPVGMVPLALVVADFNRDGRPDLATANTNSDDVSVLLNTTPTDTATPTFSPHQSFAVGHAPIADPLGAPLALVVADFNGDGFPDLATANYLGDLSVLQNITQKCGTTPDFAEQVKLGATYNPFAFVVADFNGDGKPDLATANTPTDDRLSTVSVLLNTTPTDIATPTFAPQQKFSVGKSPYVMVTADFNGDGRPDLATANYRSSDGSVLLGHGDGSFENSQLDPFGSPDATPLFVDVNGGSADVLVLDGRGNIFLRTGIAAPPSISPSAFTAPITVNTAPALDVAVVKTTAGGPFLAAVNKLDDNISIYTVSAAGSGSLVDTVVQPALSRPVRIDAADFNGDGRGDLAIVNAGNQTVTVFLQQAGGSFALHATLPVGAGHGEIALADFDQDGFLDILVSSRTSGDVSIFLNDGAGNFTVAGHFRAGFGLEGLETAFDGSVFVHSLAQTTGLTIGDFDEDGVRDIVAMNSNYHSFTFLAGTGKGTIVNATVDSSRTLTNTASTLIRSGFFDGDTHLDVAVLNPDEQTITIFLGDGHGGFSRHFTTKAGIEPTGFSVADVDANGRPDLLVGNELGDLLILFGRGDGTFEPPHPAGRSIPLAVVDLDGDGRDDFVFANELSDKVFVQFGGTAPAFFQGAENGLFAPDAVRLIKLNDDLVDDLVVANSGANQVIVYLGEMVGGTFQFRTDAKGVHRFDVGTNPVSMTFAKLNGDALLDIIVTNKGSNSLTFLQSAGSGDSWTLTNNVRSNTGLNGAPTSTLLRDVRRADGSAGRDGILDILVSNSQSNTVSVIPGNGGGNFDLNPSNQINVGINPTLLLPVTGGFISLNSGSGTLTRISDSLQVVATVATRGFNPSTALAGDFNGDGATDLLVGSGDGILELFLDNGGELLTAGFLDTGLNISAMALSVIEGSRVFYVTKDGAEQAFAFSLDDFASEDRGTVADLGDSSSVAIIAALVAGSAELSAADFFTGQDGETVNFGELLFFSENGEAPEGAGGGDSSTEALAQLQELVRQIVQESADTFGVDEGGGFQVIVSAVQGVLDTVGAVEVAGFNPFAGWQTVVAHLQLPGIGESLVSSLVKAGQATLPAEPVAAGMPGDAALRDVVFGSSLAAPFDGFESLAVADEAAIETSDNEPLWPVEAMARWWALPVERQTEELLLAGLLAATLWKPEASGRTVPGRRPAPAG